MKALIHTNERFASYAILFIRIMLGIVMFAHGAQKVLGAFGGKGLDATVQGMTEHSGIPAPLAYLSAFTEFLGGIALIFGVLTRFFSIAVAINMLVAVFMVHLSKGLLGQGGFEFPLSLAIMAIAVAIAGPGRYSIDHRLFAERTT